MAEGRTVADTVSRPVTSSYCLEIGSGSIYDSYISPLKFRGVSVALTGKWDKAMRFNPTDYTMQFESAIRLIDAQRAHFGSSMYLAEVDFSWGLNRRVSLPYRIQLAAGATIGFKGGVIYLPGNGNNPASAIASADISLRASLSRPFRFGRLPVLISETVTLPSLGVFFSPEFGESYYEIYLGNRKGLANFGWWGNHFGLDNLLSAIMDFGRTALTIGYRFDVSTSYIHHLNRQVFSHAFVVGVVPHGLGMKPKVSHKNAVINALY